MTLLLSSQISVYVTANRLYAFQVRLSVYLSAFLLVCLFACLSPSLFVYLSVSLLVSLFFYLSVCVISLLSFIIKWISLLMERCAPLTRWTETKTKKTILMKVLQQPKNRTKMKTIKRWNKTITSHYLNTSSAPADSQSS